MDTREVVEAPAFLAKETGSSTGKTSGIDKVYRQPSVGDRSSAETGTDAPIERGRKGAAGIGVGESGRGRWGREGREKDETGESKGESQTLTIAFIRRRDAVTALGQVTKLLRLYLVQIESTVDVYCTCILFTVSLTHVCVLDSGSNERRFQGVYRPVATTMDYNKP